MAGKCNQSIHRPGLDPGSRTRTVVKPSRHRLREQGGQAVRLETRDSVESLPTCLATRSWSDSDSVLELLGAGTVNPRSMMVELAAR